MRSDSWQTHIQLCAVLRLLGIVEIGTCAISAHCNTEQYTKFHALHPELFIQKTVFSVCLLCLSFFVQFEGWNTISECFSISKFASFHTLKQGWAAFLIPIFDLFARNVISDCRQKENCVCSLEKMHCCCFISDNFQDIKMRPILSLLIWPFLTSFIEKIYWRFASNSWIYASF